MDRQMTINENVAKHIWHDILQCSRIPLKWCFDMRTVQVIENGTTFRVNAPFVRGWVKIQQETDGHFKVSIKPDTFGSELTYESVSSEKLISTIDRVLSQGILTENTEPQSYRVAV